MSKRLPDAERRTLDCYDTPAWAVRRLLESYDLPVHGRFIEPAYGGGAIVDVCLEWDPSVTKWTIFDIEPRGNGTTKRDWIADQPDRFDDASLCISNPPYSIAQEFIEASFRQCPNADVVMLLRLGFLASEKRAKFFARYGVPDLYILPNRPSFTEDGKTDSSDYAWFVWPKRRASQFGGIVKMLEPTPREERK